MASQLIYAKSRSIHGSMVQRLCRAVKPGYAVVGKTRINSESEDRLIELARHGVEKDGMSMEPHFLYLPDFTSRGTQHVFGSVRLAKRGGVTGADYIAHFLVLTEEEVQAIWQKGARLTPAGLLLILELRGFWAQSWRGPAKWLTNEDLPNWEEAETELQAQVQPTWQHYTGHKRFAALLKESQYREACMLALPGGTPSVDMLRLLHEADYLRSDLGWSIPVFTRGGAEITEFSQVQLLGLIGSRMHRQAMLTGIPVIEVTEQLSAGPEVPNARLAPPPLFTAPQAAVENCSPRDAGRRRNPIAAKVLAKLVTVLGALIILGAVALCLNYVWQNRSELSDKVNKVLVPADGYDEPASASKEPSVVEPPISATPFTSDEEQLARQRIAPVLVGHPIPSCAKCFFSDSECTLTTGRVSIYHFSPDGKPDILSCGLDGEAYYVVISPGDTAGTWILKLLTQSSVVPDATLTVTTRDGVLHSITDETGQGVALLLPVCENGELIGKVLFLSTLQVQLPEIGDEEIDKKVDALPMLTPECLISDSQKLALSSSSWAKKWKQSLTGEIDCTVEDLLSLPSAAERNKLVVEGDAADLFRSPLRGEMRGEMICYSPKLKIRYDLGQPVVARMLRFANATHSSKGRKKRDAHSIAGIWSIVTRLLDGPAAKKDEGLVQYARLFADAEFADFCERELSYMTRPHHGSVTGEGTRIKVDPKVLKRLMIVNFHDVQRCLCERLTQEARAEFSHSLKQQKLRTASGKQLFLRDVKTTAPGELTWFFEARPAE